MNVSKQKLRRKELRKATSSWCKCEGWKKRQNFEVCGLVLRAGRAIYSYGESLGEFAKDAASSGCSCVSVPESSLTYIKETHLDDFRTGPHRMPGDTTTTVLKLSQTDAARAAAILDKLRHEGVNVQSRTLGSEGDQVKLEITTGPPGEANPNVRRDGRIAIPTSDPEERKRICDEVMLLNAKGVQLNCLLRDDIVYVGTVRT